MKPLMWKWINATLYAFLVICILMAWNDMATTTEEEATLLNEETSPAGRGMMRVAFAWAGAIWVVIGFCPLFMWALLSRYAEMIPQEGL